MDRQTDIGPHLTKYTALCLYYAYSSRGKEGLMQFSRYVQQRKYSSRPAKTTAVRLQVAEDLQQQPMDASACASDCMVRALHE